MGKYITPRHHCPSCFQVTDECFDADNTNEKREPVKGDINVCGYCGEISVFDEKIEQHLITKDELETFKKEQPENYILMMKASEFCKARVRHN